jgi:hypothetical protein
MLQDKVNDTRKMYDAFNVAYWQLEKPHVYGITDFAQAEAVLRDLWSEVHDQGEVEYEDGRDGWGTRTLYAVSPETKPDCYDVAIVLHR